MTEETLAEIIARTVRRRDHYLEQTRKAYTREIVSSVDNMRLKRETIEEVLEIMVTVLTPEEYIRLLELGKRER